MVRTTAPKIAIVPVSADSSAFALILFFNVSTYSVYCYRFEDSPELIESGLDLEGAQSICRDPETSSRTASDPFKHGSNPWFYGFTEE